MEQMYSCPNCGEVVYYGEPACPNCGMQLDWSTVDMSPPQDDYQYQDYGQDQQWNQQQWDQQQWTPPPEDYQQAEYGQYYQPPPPGKRVRSGKMSKPPAQKRPPGNSSAASLKRKKMIKIVVLSVVCIIIAAAAISLGLGFNPFASDTSEPSSTTTPASGNTTQTIPVTGPIEIVSLEINPPVIPVGNSAILSWEVTGAKEVSIDQDVGIVSPIAQMSISPSSTTTYTITASNDAGTKTEQVTISVNIVAPKITFTAEPATIAKGGSSTLSWEVTGATTIKLGHEDIEASGSKTVNDIDVTTVYTITATNSAGVTEATTKVTIGASGEPVIIAFGADPDFLNAGESSTLAWHVTNADSVSINQGIGAVPVYQGSEEISPTSTTTYILTASNSAGTSSMEVTVTISSDGNPVISDFYASPVNITTGQTSTLHWTVAGAKTIFIDPGIGAVSASGTQTVSPNTTTTYTLSATNDNGTTTATFTVNFGTVDLPEIEQFTASSTSIYTGDPLTITWLVTNANTVAITPDIGTVEASGSITLYPMEDVTYTLTAVNENGTETASKSVDVN